MIKYLKAKNHKGISEVKLLDLDQINVICGKNNSGKTSILEALISKNINKTAIGKKVDDLQFLEKVFSSQAGRYSEPASHNAMVWFTKYISQLKNTGMLWFSDEIEKIASDFQVGCKKDPYLGRWGGNTYSFNVVPDRYFDEDRKTYNPILIPPKRHLETDAEIQLATTPDPTGQGLLNRLFFLKNQAPESDESKKYEIISNAFFEITDHYFNIFSDKANRIRLVFKRDKGVWLPADSCGLGLSDVLIIICCSIDFDYTPILIEEPESHVHPDMQRKLLHFMRSCKDKQFLLTTHSNIFLNNALIDKVFFVSFNETVEINDVTSRAAVLDDLGYSVADNLVADIVILVEGPKDVPIIEEFLIKMELYEPYGIKIWPLGGDIMDQLDLSIFLQSYKTISIIDNDPDSKRVRERFKGRCDEYNIPVVRLKRYAIENYFSVRALKEVFGSQMPETITEIDPKKKLKDQIGIDVKNNNRRLAQTMSIEEIKGTDLCDFFSEVEKMCEKK